jgi:8-oxo-dGTP diphosphatase
MTQVRHIVKIGLAITDANRLLLVRKRGGVSYILPGGKPEVGEDDLQALAREVDEELGCKLDSASLAFLGVFSDSAADMRNTVVTVRLYEGRLVGAPAPRSEIECLAWFRPDSEENVTLAPSIQNQIIPFLFSTGKLAAAN